PEKSEVEELRRRLSESQLPEHVRKEADRELTRLERMPAAAPDFQLTRTYLELLLELPWTQTTDDVIDLEKTRQILDTDHFGLDEVKERILEELAVLKLNPKAKAQNSTFRDNYLDLPFDLSKVLFITTANTLDTVPRPLLDRMEVLRLSGYSEEEKMEIATRYLLPRQLNETGIKPEQLTIPPETLQRII